MSEYVTVETRSTDDPNVIEIITNQVLTEAGEEVYDSVEAGDEGSPIAQMLFSGVTGIRALVIRQHELIITRTSDAAWEEIIDEIRDALRDFFL